MDLTDSLLRRVLTDTETGLCNRNGFRLEMERTFERSRRYGFPISILTFRCDGADSEVLVQLARRVASSLRSSDFLARTGNRELRLLLTHEDAVCSDRVAGRLGELCHEFERACPDGVYIETTLRGDPKREDLSRLLDDM
jgi:GGDEF domain-containing protein